jgi:hypothetical protein
MYPPPHLSQGECPRTLIFQNRCHELCVCVCVCVYIAFKDNIHAGAFVKRLISTLPPAVRIPN